MALAVVAAAPEPQYGIGTRGHVVRGTLRKPVPWIGTRPVPVPSGGHDQQGTPAAAAPSPPATIHTPAPVWRPRRPPSTDVPQRA